jgi:hypothetical protein
VECAPYKQVCSLPFSAPPLSNTFGNEDPVVWADFEGIVKGQDILTFHPKQTYAAKQDPRLYELLALVDAIRIGRVREKHIAEAELKTMILNE